MTSSLTWLDYSEKERQQVAEVISLFGEETARDELGIGVIRDTFSNALALYCMVFGQPRQEDLLEHLLKRLPQEKIQAYLNHLQINLTPPSK